MAHTAGADRGPDDADDDADADADAHARTILPAAR